MSIRKVVCGLGMCVWIPLSANVHAIALFQFESVESAASGFQYYIPPIPMVEDGMGGTRENSNNLPWNRSLNVILPLVAEYLDTLAVSEDFASPSIGLYLPLLGENEDFDANISGFVQDEEEFENLFVIPDLFMQAEWQPTESILQSAPFTPHSYGGNVARARNIASACMQARDVRGSKSGLRDSDCIEAGSGESGSVANRSGSMAGSGPRLLSARSARGSGTVDGVSSGGTGGGGAGDRRDATAPGIGGSGNGGGMSSPGSNNSDPDNSSEDNSSGAEGSRSNQGNGNNGTGESSGGGGGTGGNEDWGSGNGDTGNWNNPGKGEGPPPSEVAIIPEPATLTLLALGLAVLCAVRRNQGKTVG